MIDKIKMNGGKKMLQSKNAIIKSPFIITKNYQKYVTIDILDQRNKPFDHIYNAQQPLICCAPRIFRNGKILAVLGLTPLAALNTLRRRAWGTGKPQRQYKRERCAKLQCVK